MCDSVPGSYAQEMLTLFRPFQSLWEKVDYQPVAFLTALSNEHVFLPKSQITVNAHLQDQTI